MERMIFFLPENENVATKMAASLNVPIGQITFRHFPDGETYVRVLDNVKGKEIILLCTLHQPDVKLLPLFFLSKTLKDQGAKKIILVTPYLAYMRQDKQFHSGEGVTNKYFAEMISLFADELITIDPHLHRVHSMADIYSIPAKVLHASSLISDYIRTNMELPLLIGPDSESEQWVSAIAKEANAPFVVLNKERMGDKEVKVSIPHIEKYRNYTPVLVDDIISTGKTMIETIAHLKAAGTKAPICIGVHGIFAGNAFNELKEAGAAEIITTNSIQHPSNKIDITPLLCSDIQNLNP